MFFNLNKREQEKIMALYALLCSDQDASIRFLDRVGSSLGSKTEAELRDHYNRCFTDFLLNIRKKRLG